MDVTSFSASFVSEGDEKEDTDADEEEETKMQQSLLGFYRKYNLSMLEEKEISGVAFGVRTDDASTMTCPLNDAGVNSDVSTPTPMRRSISFNDVVQLNHVDSFKHELSTKEKEQCWYTDVEQVTMKIDGGVYHTAGAETQRKKEEEEEEARQRQHRARTGTLTKAEKKRAKEMRKKYGIDKKVKKNRSKSIGRSTSTAVTALTRSASTDAATDTSTTKKKKKGFSSLFGKKKKK